MSPPSPAEGAPEEQPRDVELPGPSHGAEGSPRNQQSPNPTPGVQGPLNPSGGAQVSTTYPAPSAMNSSIAAPSLSAIINGMSTMNLTTQPTTSPPEVPATFLTYEFMQSVARALDDFDLPAFFRPEDTAINFEQDFREWFNPDDLDMK